MNKFKKTLAIFFAIGAFTLVSSKALADENSKNNEKNKSVFDILTNDLSSSEKSSSHESGQNILSPSEKADFDEEYELRFSLLKDISIISMSNIDFKADDFYRLVNNRNLSKDELKENIKILDDAISKNSLENKLKDTDLTKFKTMVMDFLYKGKLINEDFFDKSDLDSLHLFYEASLRSVAYQLSDFNTKKNYDKLFSEIYELLLDLDGKRTAGKQLSSDDKKMVEGYYKKLPQLVDEERKGNLLEKSTTLSNSSYLSQAGSTNNQEYDSPFFKSERTKAAYLALTDSQRSELDSMNTNSDDVLSDDEISKSSNYSLPLPSEHWLNPFMANGQISSSPVTASPNTVPATTTPNLSAPSTSPANTGSPETLSPSQNAYKSQISTPETVTISSTENTDLKSKTDDKKDATTNSYASKQVKTGIPGITYVGVILIVAILAFIFLGKKKK